MYISDSDSAGHGAPQNDPEYSSTRHSWLSSARQHATGHRRLGTVTSDLHSQVIYTTGGFDWLIDLEFFRVIVAIILKFELEKIGVENLGKRFWVKEKPTIFQTFF